MSALISGVPFLFYDTRAQQFDFRVRAIGYSVSDR
jgi:hypothetical protein